MFRFFKNKKENIWQKLIKQKKGKISILAPMLDVTDKPFRQIVSGLGAPDVFFTEFVSVDGLVSEGGRKRLLLMLEKSKYEKKNKNLIFQVFGSDPEKFAKAIKIIKKLNPAGIDINIGCPDKAVIKQGSGSALMKVENWERLKNIYDSCKKEAGNIPISIKTRVGFEKIDWAWIRFVLSLQPQAITVHLRTTKEMSKSDAHWEIAEKINYFRNEISPKTILIGNGDIETMKQGIEKIKKSGFDGFMVGRGIFYNPALFGNKDFNSFSPKEKLEILFKHLDLFEKEFYKNNNWVKSFALMKKFLKIYISGFDGAKDLRVKLMKAKKAEEIKNICRNFLEKKI